MSEYKREYIPKKTKKKIPIPVGGNQHSYSNRPDGTSYTLTDPQRRKLSKMLTGKTKTEEHKKKIRDSMAKYKTLDWSQEMEIWRLWADERRTQVAIAEHFGIGRNLVERTLNRMREKYKATDKSFRQKRKRGRRKRVNTKPIVPKPTLNF